MQRTITVCDLHDGGDVPAVATVTVSVDGRLVQLDACRPHLELLAALPVATTAAAQEKHVGAASETGRPSRRRPAANGTGRTPERPRKAGEPKGGAQSASRRQLQRERAVVREWARQNGRDVGDKGRLPAGLVEEYRRTQEVAS